MVDLPGRSAEDESDGDPAGASPADEAVVSCEFQDGTLSVYGDRVVIERSGASRFDDTEIPFDRIEDVTYAGRLVIGYLQILTPDVTADTSSLLSTPVDENTLHFGRGKRDCAQRARDAILERTSAT